MSLTNYRTKLETKQTLTHSFSKKIFYIETVIQKITVMCIYGNSYQ